jgi:hypothetical protein
MKLYNIYQNVILEEIINQVHLLEAVPVDDIEKVLTGDGGKYYHVSFDYTDNKGNVSNRFVQIHQRNISTRNNNLIDAYQISRDGQTSGVNPRTGKPENFEGWKKFDLNKMSNFKITKIPFYQPKFKFNRSGNNSSSIVSTPTIAQFDYQYSPSTVKQLDKTKKTLFPNVGKNPEEIKPTVQPAPQPKPPVRPMKRVVPKPTPKPEEPIVEPEDDEIEDNLELNR